MNTGVAYGKRYTLMYTTCIVKVQYIRNVPPPVDFTIASSLVPRPSYERVWTWDYIASYTS